MNDDFRNSSIDLELQVRLMNLVMGEASDFERDQLQALMEQRPELAAYCEHVEHLHGLLNEAAIGDLDQLSIGDQASNGIEASTDEEDGSHPTWQLSTDRRNQLLAVFDGTQEPANDEKVCLDNKKPWWRMPPRRVAEISVVVACLFVAIGLLRPSVQSSRQAPIVLGRKEFDATGSTNWSFNPATVQGGKFVMPADGRFNGEYFNAQAQDYKPVDSLYRRAGDLPPHYLDGIPSAGFAVQETVQGRGWDAQAQGFNRDVETTNRGREMFLAEGKSASPSNASGPVDSGKTSGAASEADDYRRAQVQSEREQGLAERELVELRKSTALEALSVSPNQPLADLPAVQLEKKNQIDDLAALAEVGAKSEAGTQLNNFSKGFSFQSNGIDATEKSVQEASRPQGDSSAGEANMLGRITAEQADNGRTKSNQEAEGLERSKALADLGPRVDSNRPEDFFDRAAGAATNFGDKPGADGEAKTRFSRSPSAGKSGDNEKNPVTGAVEPLAIAALDPKRNPDPYQNLPSSNEGWKENNNGARTIVGLSSQATSDNPFPFTTNLDTVFENPNSNMDAVPFGGVARDYKAPATGAPTPSNALGINNIHEFERPQANQLLGDLYGQNETFGWADQSTRFGDEHSLKQQSGDESSSLWNKSIQKDTFDRSELGFVDSLQDVDEAAVPLDGTPSPVDSPDAKAWKALNARRKERYGQVAPNTNYFAAPSFEPQDQSPKSIDEFSVPSDTSGSFAQPNSGELIGKAISPESRRLATGTIVNPRGGEVLSKGKSDAKEEMVAEKPAKKSYLEASKDSAPEVDASSWRWNAKVRKRKDVANDELSASSAATSTFSLHVSDVSFKLAQAALQQGQMPDASKIRIEEFVNALDYRDPWPDRQEKVSCTLEQAVHPFLMQRNLLRISMRTAIAGRTQSTPLRLTIVLDNSGSMERPDRRQAVLRAFQTLTQQLTDKDQVTLISFANTPRLLADKVPGNQGESLLQLVESLPSEGGTNIESALKLAREKAMEQRVDAAQNRIVLMTDGAVNLGDADPTSLSKLVVQLRESGIAFDAAGICSQDLNDEVLESLTRQGDGRYYLLDSPESIGEDFAAQIAGALRPSAKNVKVQVEFNPQRVGKYKLLGFEKHRLNQEDFRNDSVDAAELAAAEAGVAVYQIQPIPGGSGDIGSVSVRFRDMATGQMIERRWPIVYDACTNRFDVASPTIRLAGTAAMLATKFAGGAQADQVDLAQLKKFIAALPEALANHPRTQQLRTMIDQARQIAGE